MITDKFKYAVLVWNGSRNRYELAKFYPFTNLTRSEFASASNFICLPLR